EMEFVPFDLDDVLNNLSDVAAARAFDKPDLEILFRVSPQVPRRLVGDPLRLGQVLTNLVANAIKFTARGEIVVTVDVKHDSPDAATLRFAVSDTGIGLTQDQIAGLFRPFAQ